MAMMLYGMVFGIHDFRTRQDLYINVTHAAPSGASFADMSAYRLKKPLVVVAAMPSKDGLQGVFAALPDGEKSAFPEGFTPGRGTNMWFGALGVEAWDGRYTTKKRKSPVHRLRGFDPESIWIQAPEGGDESEQPALLTLEYASQSLVAQAAEDAVVAAEASLEIEDETPAVPEMAMVVSEERDLAAELTAHLVG